MKNGSTETGLIQRVKGDFTYEDIDRPGWLDRQLKKQRRHGYQEVKRDIRLEEIALRKTVECKTFTARLRPQACMLRKQIIRDQTCLECNFPVQQIL